MAKVSIPSHLHCRYCGSRFKHNEVNEHELQCLVSSEEAVDENLSKNYPESNKQTEGYVDERDKKEREKKNSPRKETKRSPRNVAKLQKRTPPTKKSVLAKQDILHCRYCGDNLKKYEISEHELHCKDHIIEPRNEEPSTSHSEDDTSKNSTPCHGGKRKKEKSFYRRTKEKSPTKDKKSKNQKSLPSEELPVPGLQNSGNSKDELKEIAYPKVSEDMLREAEKSKDKVQEKDSLPANALPKNEPKQAWNANIGHEMKGKLEDPFPPAKKYRHYPVSCEFCNKKFQPGPLRRHIQKYHPDEHLPPSKRGKGRIRPPGREEEIEKKKKPVGPPRQMKFCYICGRMFGSKSIKIHEPKCLEKWKIENERLPKDRRMPEPVKPEVIKGSPGPGEDAIAGSKSKELPELDAEAEAAYRCHLKNLVPCQYCQRTFNPDRVMVHENACIERPKKRKRPARRR
ncbi:zinc finger protein 474 [Trichonephila clavipes]|nr:zinc finger protein 474 [Trichonephila clavipes]